MTSLSPAVQDWVERCSGPFLRVTEVESLPNSSTRKQRIVLTAPGGGSMQVLLRRYHDAARLASDPWYLPAHDGAVLRSLEPAEIPTPLFLASDLDGRICGVPAILEEFLPGRPEWQPADLESYVRCTAEALVTLHAFTRAADLPAYAPYEDRRHATSPAFSTRPGLWEAVAAVLRGPRPAFRQCFIHRDYHPGNVLMKDGVVTGIVDWATAARGPAGIDLARMRLNLAWRLGAPAAAGFLAAYVAAGGDPAERHPYWDLLDAADAMPFDAPPPDPRELARFEDWVAGVLSEV